MAPMATPPPAPMTTPWPSAPGRRQSCRRHKHGNTTLTPQGLALALPPVVGVDQNDVASRARRARLRKRRHGRRLRRCCPLSRSVSMSAMIPEGHADRSRMLAEFGRIRPTCYQVRTKLRRCRPMFVNFDQKVAKSRLPWRLFGNFCEAFGYLRSRPGSPRVTSGAWRATFP